MTCECKDRGTRSYYRYYDTPDGCDVSKKIIVTSRYGAIAGLIMSTYDVLMYSHAIGLGPILRRYAYHTIPPTLAGATFAAVANGAQHLREQDDVLNYFIGGVACGPILAYYLKSYHALFLGGLGLGIIGMIKKHAIDNNFPLFPQPRGHMRTIRSWKNDYTLVEDPRNRGVACGPILAYYLKSYHALFLGGLGLGIIGMIKKHAIDNNFPLFPQPRGHMRTIRSWKNDYTLVEDPRNRGVACGPILAYYLKSYHALFLGGLGLGIIGMIKKHAIDNNFPLFPQPRGHMRTIRSWKNDYTLVEDPRNTMRHICGANKK